MKFISDILGGPSRGRKNKPLKQMFVETEPLSAYEQNKEDKIYRVDGNNFPPNSETPWGDYGQILVHGMTMHLGPKDGQLQLERTGPFVPPITFPGVHDIIVTTAMKEIMERAGFNGISFRKVIKARIVEINWHAWDFTAEEPKYFPKTGEPEDYILEKNHSEKVCGKIGDLWEVVLSVGAVVERKELGDWKVEFLYIPGSWNGADLFSVSDNWINYSSLRAKRWFQQYFPEWTSFNDVLIKI